MQVVDPLELRNQFTETVLAHDYSVGPLLILAGPGTGKTYCLLETIQRKTGEGYSLGEFFEATLTNAAADDFLSDARKRISKDFTMSSTLHFRAKGLLHARASTLQLNPAFTVIDLNCEDMILGDLATLLEMDGPRVRGATRQYRTEVAQAKDTESNFSDAYRRIQHFYSVLDWFDVMRLACRLLADNEDIRNEESSRFKFLLIDEYQDLNPADQQFVQLLLNGRGTLLAVGDDDQSIYSSRFADSRGITKFRSRYPRAEVIQLPVTSRIPSAVIEASYQLISRNASRAPKDKLVSLPDTDSRANGGLVVSVNNKSDKAEAQFIYDAISSLIDRKVPPKEILVLCSCRALGLELLGRIQQLDEGNGIPIRNDLEIENSLSSADYVFQQLQSLIANRGDNLAARVVVGEVAKGLSEDHRILVSFAMEHDITIWTALEDEELLASLPATRPKLEELRRRIENLDPDMSHLENASQLVNAFPPFTDLARRISLGQGVGIEASEGESASAEQQAVRFITFHSSKGLEADFVFMPFLEEALGLPGDDDEERRRLLYVALTRAKVGVAMSWAWSRRSDKRFKCSGIGGDVTHRAPAPSIEECGVPHSLIPLWEQGSSAATAIEMLCRHAEAIYL